MSRLFRQDSNIIPGAGVCHSQVLIATTSFPESTFHHALDAKAGQQVGAARHRLANSVVDNTAAPDKELQLYSQGNKTSPLQSQPSLPHGFLGARCRVHINANSSPLAAAYSDSPTKRARLPPLNQRILFEATRDAMLAEEHTGQFSPLSPGCPNSSKRLQELFGLFRGDGLERTNTEGPDELLSQVAAEAATGEFDNLGDPADLRDLVSSDSAITDADVGGYSSAYLPLGGHAAASSGLPAAGSLQMGHEPAPTQPFVSASMQFRGGGAAPMVPMPASSAFSGGSLSPPLQQGPPALPMHARPERASTMASQLHTTQIVLAPRAASVPEVPVLPPHLATGPPSPVKRTPAGGRPFGAAPAPARGSSLEVAGGGVAKRAGLKASRHSSDALRAAPSGTPGDDGTASQRTGGSDADGAPAAKPKPKRASSGERRPRRMTCNYCKTHVTPQWRCGPDGPRTLCNACGVRWGKGKLELPDGTKAVHPNAARKAALAAAEEAAADGDAPLDCQMAAEDGDADMSLASQQ